MNHVKIWKLKKIVSRLEERFMEATPQHNAAGGEFLQLKMNENLTS